MGIGYQKRDLEICDYQLYGLKTPKRVFILRGPKPIIEENNYICCVGSAFTFGCLCEKPYPAVLQECLSIKTLNLAIAGVGPKFFLRPENSGLLEKINQSKLAIVLVMSGRSDSNSIFDNSKGLEKFIRISDNKIIAASNAYEELLKTESPEYVRQIVNETRQNYINNYKKLLNQIRVPKILFWFSSRPPQYQEEYDNLRSLFGGFPELVNLEMINELKKYANHYVECISSRGKPHKLINRFTGNPTSITGREDLGSKKRAMNTRYPSPEMHLHAAEILEPVCQKYL